MANSVTVAFRADVADLVAKRAILSAELRAANKDLNDFARASRAGGGDQLRAGLLGAAQAAAQAKAAIAATDAQMRSFSATQAVVAGVTGQQRAGLQQLGYQLGDFSTQLALGARPAQAFAAQIGQTIGAVQLMVKEGSALASFLSGPWGIAAAIGAQVLLPLVGNLLETKDGADKAGDSTLSLADAEAHLQAISKADRTGDLARAADLLADARTRQAQATIMAARAQALLNLEDAKKRVADLQDGKIDRPPTFRRRRARGGDVVDVIDNDIVLSDRRARGQGSQLENARAAAAADVQRYQDEVDQLEGRVARLADVRLRNALQADTSLARSRLALRTATDSLSAAEARRDIIERQAQIRIDSTTLGTKARADAEENYVRVVKAANAEVERIRNARDADQGRGAKRRSGGGARSSGASDRADRDEAAQARQIALGDADTTLALAKIDIAGRRRDVEALAQTELLTEEEKRDRLKALAQEEADAEIAAQEAKRKAYDGDVVAVSATADQEKIIRAQLVNDLKAIDREYADDKERLRQQDLQRQKEADRQRLDDARTRNAQILSVEDQLVSGILSGRQTLGQVLRTVALQTVEQQIRAELRYQTEKRLLAAEGLATDAATSQKSVLFHGLGETAKVAAISAGQASQAAVTATGAAAKGQIVAASNLKEITSHAATAAAAAYHAMAGIPVIGPVLGAAAAATTFAAVEAYGALASFDKGADIIPRDMVAKIHAGERIIPRDTNARLEQMLKSGGGPGGAHQFHTNYNATINAAGVRGEDVMAALEDRHHHLFRLIARGVREGKLKLT